MMDTMGCHSEPKGKPMPFALRKIKNLVAHGREIYATENEILRRFVIMRRLRSSE